LSWVGIKKIVYEVYIKNIKIRTYAYICIIFNA